jgi:hypothetical protein
MRTGGRAGEMSGRRQPLNDLYKYFVDYARENPEMAALWCFGIGFILGWKMKPW